MKTEKKYSLSSDPPELNLIILSIPIVKFPY